MACAAAMVLVYDRQLLALAVAPLAAAILYSAERWEAGTSHAEWKETEHRSIPFSPAWIIPPLVLLALLPTLTVWFSSDDFGCLSSFHNLSLDGFFRMFHTDLSTLVEGEAGQEIRPFYSVFYFVNYTLWGMNPAGYHLLTIGGHIVNALLVFRITTLIAPGNSLRAFLAALLFAFQPAHSMAVSWIAGAPAEVFPTLFYLTAFLCYVQFRRTGKGAYLAASTAAFLACLCSKEIAVTLPLMLVSYDLFGPFLNPATMRDSQPAFQRIKRAFPAWCPFILLLVSYLAWRHFVFSHVLGENFWADSLGLSFTDSSGGAAHLLRSITHLGRALAGQYVFALRSLLVPFSSLVSGIVLGIYLVWVLALMVRRSDAPFDIPAILFCGLVWFFIADLPLLVASMDARHLYLPAVGPSIAVALCALPSHADAHEPKSIRLASGALLVALAAGQLVALNSEFKQGVAAFASEAAQLQTLVTAMPDRALVVINCSQEFLPFLLQPPFTTTDLTRNHPVIARPENYGWTTSAWWNHVDHTLRTVLAAPPNEPIELDVLTWDEQAATFIHSKRVLPQATLASVIGSALADPGVRDDAEAVTQGDALVESLVNLTRNGAVSTRASVPAP